VRVSLATVAAVAAAGAYGWEAAGLRPFTVPMEVVVAVPEALLAAAAWRRRGRNRSGGGNLEGNTSTGRVGTPTMKAGSPTMKAGTPTMKSGAPWLVLVAMLAALEGANYLSSPRAAHPTLSYIASEAMAAHPARAVLMALWLLVGWAMFLR
jgi:hypothetical protein